MSSVFRVEWRDETAFRTVWIFGEVDLGSVGELQEALDCDQGRLQVDLGNVTFMDLSGLTCLLEAAEKCDVVVLGSSPRVDRLLDLTGTRQVFQWSE